MIITLSPRTGPVKYEIEGEPRLVEGDFETFYEITLHNPRTGGSRATLKLSLDEVALLGALGRKPSRRK